MPSSECWASLALPCLPPAPPWSRGLSSSWREAEGPRLLSSCRMLGSGRSPLPRLRACREDQRGSSEPCLTPWLPHAPPLGHPPPTARTHRGLGSNESSQHAAARGPGGAEGDAQMAASQGQAVCPLLGLLCLPPSFFFKLRNLCLYSSHEHVLLIFDCSEYKQPTAPAAAL